jgi:tetratricopeptide (TPR) repeat protein
MAKKHINRDSKKKRTKQRPKQSTSTQNATTPVGLPGAHQLVAAADHAALHQSSEDAIQLYTKAEQHLLNYEKNAVDFNSDDETNNIPAEYRQCLLQVLEKRAELKVSVEDQEGAFQDYQQALEILEKEPVQPQEASQRASLYLYIGQLQVGKDAVDAYQKGIGCLQSTLEQMQRDFAALESLSQEMDEAMVQGDNDDDDDDDDEDESKPVDPQKAMAETQRQLAAACCSVADVYLTDLCFEEDAEQECESFLNKAMLLPDVDGEPVIDALQTAASLRLSQNRGLEAVDFILRAYEKIRVGCEALSSLVNVRNGPESEQATELVETEAVRNLPGFEFRCQTAKLLIECAGILKEEKPGDPRETQCTQAAVDVLGSLLAENDEVAEIWYLTGDAFAAMTPPNMELAAHYWEATNEMLTSVKESLEQGELETEDEEESHELRVQLDEVTLQLDQLQTKLAEFSDPDAQEMEE